MIGKQDKADENPYRSPLAQSPMSGPLGRVPRWVLWLTGALMAIGACIGYVGQTVRDSITRAYFPSEFEPANLWEHGAVHGAVAGLTLGAFVAAFAQWCKNRRSHLSTTAQSRSED